MKALAVGARRVRSDRNGETVACIWENMAGRLGGPLTFRLILQPLVAAILALRAGLADVHMGRRAYFWAILAIRSIGASTWARGGRTSRRCSCSPGIDIVYRIMRQRWVYPDEALIVAIMLAFVPYLLIRGSVTRIARSLVRRS